MKKDENAGVSRKGETKKKKTSERGKGGLRSGKENRKKE